LTPAALSPELRRALRLAAATLLVAAVYWLNQHTRPEIRLGILYFVPVLVVTWSDGLIWGVAFAAVTTLLRYVLALDQMPLDTPTPVRLTNEAAYLIVLAVAMTGLAKLQRTQSLLELLATHDLLTGTLNARSFTERLSQEFGRIRRYHRPLALLYLDLDDFKAVNDRHGHETGDAVLRLVADATRSAVRQSDIVGRLGGDEFAVLMPETEGPVAQAAAARLVGSIREGFRGTPSVTVSIGVVSTPNASAGPEELLRQADQAMYEAKRGGKDRVVQVALP
jgi:diguanylate cyclase (GGDEF)-like protein